MFGLDYFDSILLNGDYQADDIRFLEKLRGLPEKQLVATGCSYLDVYAEKIKLLPRETEHPFTVLVSPSWGPSALLSLYGKKLLDPLASSGWRIIIRPHPQSEKSESAMLKHLQDHYKNRENIEWDFERENIYSLNKADIMISDFSGIIFDYMLLYDRPVLYVNHDFDPRPYDADDLDHELWQFKTLKEAGIELRENDFPKIIDVIKNASDNEAIAKARKKAGETAWQHRGEAGKRVFEFMTGVVNNV
jgi:CDP-glycerol glycerophosphotransferase (TagB/SpsB family)